MRNNVAEDVLSEEMLHCFEMYQSSLQNDGAVWNGVIQLLKQPSELVHIFQYLRPIQSKDAPRGLLSGEKMLNQPKYSCLITVWVTWVHVWRNLYSCVHLDLIVKMLVFS